MSDFINQFFVYNAHKEATEVMGQDDKSTGRIALHLHMLNQKEKTYELALRGDTYFPCSYEEGIQVFIDLGFEPVAIRQFQANQQVFYRHEQGILASTESEILHYRRTKRVKKILGRSTIFYNWRPNDFTHDPVSELEYLKYGHILHGDHYLGIQGAGEALKHKIGVLQQHGEFLPTWETVPRRFDLRHKEEREQEADLQETLNLILPSFDLETRLMIRQ